MKKRSTNFGEICRESVNPPPVAKKERKERGKEKVEKEQSAMEHKKRY